MELTLTRTKKTSEYTLGKLEINGIKLCDTLEDTERDLVNKETGKYDQSLKIKGKTAIPAGSYDVRLTYSIRFKKVMPELVNVPLFSGVRIHSGNSVEDTEGCILVGTHDELNKNLLLINSRITYNTLMTILTKAILSSKESVQIKIV